MITRIGNRGFTLIELVTVIIVLSILALFTFSFMDNAIRTYGLIREQSSLYADGTYIMERITRELSDATIINTADIPQYPSWSRTLTFTTARHPPPPRPAVRLATDVTYKLKDNNLLRNNEIIRKNIEDFKVTRDGTQNDAIITIELKLNRDASIPSFVLRTKVVPNNYTAADYTGRSFNGNYFETIQ